MFLELIGTVFAGIGMAGVVILLNRLTGRRLPGWAAPVAAGLGMIAMTMSMEYSWFSRTAATLPEGVTVAETHEKQGLYQPWTYLVPYVDRFAAVDTLSVKRHRDLPDRRIADLYFFGRWSALRKMPVAFDCAGGRRAILTSGTEFDSAGDIVNASWTNVGIEDPVLAVTCEVP